MHTAEENMRRISNSDLLKCQEFPFKPLDFKDYLRSTRTDSVVWNSQLSIQNPRLGLGISTPFS